MAHEFDQAPEVAEPNYPELAHSPDSRLGGSPELAHQHHGSLGQASPAKQSPHPSYGVLDSPANGKPNWAEFADTQYPQHVERGPPDEKDIHHHQRTICGCSLLVFILCCVIGLLSAAVVGLAAGTGVEANKAIDVETQLAALNQSLQSCTATSTVTLTAYPGSQTAAAADFNIIDNGCTADPESVTGTVYNSFDLLGGAQFVMHCNKDANGWNLMSLFVADFNGCMDACAGYSNQEPHNLGKNVNTTCGAVSFIPLWTARANASAGGAPGNCYLKTTQAVLKSANIGTECHAAVLVANSSTTSSRR